MQVFSKIASDTLNVEKEILDSLSKLGVERLHGLLLQGRWRDSWHELFETIKKRGRVESTGISIYQTMDFEQALQNDSVDIIQIPFNIFDQRALQNGWFEKSRAKNKKIVIRSVYLQGLLLMDPEKLPQGLSFAKPFLSRYIDFCRANGVAPKEMALSFGHHQEIGRASCRERV